LHDLQPQKTVLSTGTSTGIGMPHYITHYGSNYCPA